MSSKHTLRFAAGSPDTPRSSVWNVVTDERRSDIHLGTRSMGIAKMSLNDRAWQYSPTSQSEVAFPGTDSRHRRAWEPETHLARDWTQGPSIIIPHPGDHVPFPAKEKDSARTVVWIDGPARDNLLTLTLLMSSKTPTRPPVRPTDTRVGCIPFADGLVWIYAREDVMSPALRLWTEGRKALTVHHGDGPGPDTGSQMAMGSDPDGRPLIWEVLIGPENLAAD